MCSWTIWEQLFLPNQVSKYICRLRWLISLNSVWSYPVVSSCCLLRRFGSLAAHTTCMRTSVDLVKQTCFRVEESPFSLKCSAPVRMGFFLLQWLFFFLRMVTSWEFLLILKCIFILFIFFFLFLSTKFPSWKYLWVSGVDQSEDLDHEVRIEVVLLHQARKLHQAAKLFHSFLSNTNNSIYY